MAHDTSREIILGTEKSSFFVDMITEPFRLSDMLWVIVYGRSFPLSIAMYMCVLKVATFTCCKLFGFFLPWMRRNQVCMLINTLQSLTCDYVGCILNTCQKIKSSTLLHLYKDFLHFFCTFDSSRGEVGFVSLLSVRKLCV